MKQKIKFIADSSCDLTSEQVRELGICEVLPLYVTMGERTVEDGAFDTTEIYDFFEKTKTPPKTSSVNVYAFSEAFKKHREDGSAIIYFSISREFSGCYQNAITASQDLNDIYVVDGNASSGTALLIYKARDILEQNPDISARELADTLNGMSDKVNTNLCAEVVNYLYRGGRCGVLAFLGANLLKIRPVINFMGGKVKPGQRYRGRMTSVIPKFIEDLRENNPDYDDARCFISYTAGTSEQTIEEAKNTVEKLFDFKKIYFSKCGATITTHCGVGTLGLLFMNK